MDQGSSLGNPAACWPPSYSCRKYDRLSKAPIWRQIWRKYFKIKDKKRVFHCSNSMRFTYDPYSYSQNFDQGSFWADQDDLSRSFSARFAVPSRIFEKPGLMV
ncbi:hypothetical protein ACS0TY_035089 [Phlomoides rotata]